MAPPSLLPPRITSVRHTSASNDGDNPPLAVVGSVAEPFPGGPFSAISSGGDADDGRLPPGMGSVHRRGIGIGPMAPPRDAFHINRLEVQGSSPRSGSVSSSRQGTEGPGSIRQYYSGSLHQPPGRNSLIQLWKQSWDLFLWASHHAITLETIHLPGIHKTRAGCSLPPVAAVHRVDAEPNHFLTSSGQMPDSSGGGPVRLTVEHPNPDVLQPVSASASVARECTVIPLEGTRLLRLSPAGPSDTGTTQDRNGGNAFYPAHRPVLASQSLVPQASQVVGGPALQVATLRTFCLSQTKTYCTQTHRPWPWLLGPYQGVLHQGGVFGGSCPYGGTGTPSFHPQPL